ncbi:phage tail protein [Photobacterium atrarenae]|uniref:Phage tail protein n=1 Tax=Photobacterium atrarenae TaxID=865757 RepID=A0ABY5GB25_9GAMM|nr:phage tail protein [Photobacterium atrarenae]UTV26375.1 phage tail protein [Photobacterium atrarenae]
MAMQNLKTVVTLGGAVDSSFNKLGSVFNASMGRATQTVKTLEREQSQLTKAIDRSKKAANDLSLVEKNQQDSIQALAELEESRRGVNREIAKQRRQLKQLAAERESQASDESQSLSEINAKYARLEASIHDQVAVRDKLTGEIKKNQKAQAQFAKKAKQIRDNIEDINDLERSYDRLSVNIRQAANEADGFSKASAIKDRLRGVTAAGTVAVGSIWATTTAMTGLMTVTNDNTATVVGMAKAYDMSIERFKAWSGVARQAGLDGEHVGDLVEELSNKFGEFKALGEQSSVSEVFGALGIEAAMMDGMAAADQFEFIMKRLEGVTDKQQAASLADILFGGEGNKVITYIRNSGKSLDELLGKQRQFNLLTDQGASGAVAYGQAFNNLSSVVTSAWQEIAGIVGGEMAGDIERLSINVSRYVIQNKDAVVSTLKSLVYGAKDFTVALWNVGATVNRVVQFFGGWETVGLAVASLLAGKLVVGLGGLVVTGYKVMKTLGAMKLGAAAFNTVLAANPIGLAVAAVAGLTYAGIQLYRNWDSVTNWFSNKLTWFKTEFPTTFKVIQTLFDWSPIGMIVNHWQPVIKFFSGMWDLITGDFDAGIAKLSSVWDGFSSTFKALKFWDDDDEPNPPKPARVQPANPYYQRPQTAQQRRQKPPQYGNYPSSHAAAYQQPTDKTNQAKSAIYGSYPASRGTTVHQKVGDIHVYAAPGQSPAEVGQSVHDKLGSHRASALHDLPEVG